MKHLAYLLTGLAAGWLLAQVVPPGPKMLDMDSGSVTSTRVVYDTVRVTRPVLRDSVVLRYATVRLPMAHLDTAAAPTVDEPDSAVVELPITQLRYADSLYVAYVSGYEPRLDSITLRSPRHITTIASKPRHWYLGVTAGAALTPKGVQPYVGVGVTYSLRSL